MKLITTFLILFYATIAVSQFTAFSPQQAGTTTLDVSQAQFKGSQTFTGVGSCTWTTSSTSFTNLGTVAACSLPTYSGDAVDIGNADLASKVAGVKFNSLKAGKYVIRAMGTFYDSADPKHCYWRIADGTGTSVVQSQYNAYQGFGFEGEFSYTSDQGATTFQVQSMADTAGGNTCNIISDGFQGSGRGLQISVYYYPPETTVFQDTCTGASCINEFTAQVDGGTLNSVCSTHPCTTREETPFDFINSVTRVAAGRYTVVFNSGFFSERPHCSVTKTIGGAGSVRSWFYAHVLDANTMSIVSDDAGAAGADMGWTIKCSRNGNDYSKRDDRFVAVVDPKNTYVNVYGNGGEVVNSSTNITFDTEISDESNAWDGGGFTAPHTGIYDVKASVYYTTLAIRRHDYYVDNIVKRAFTDGDNSTNVHHGGFTLQLNKGERLTLRSNNGGTLNNDPSETQFHHITIKNIPSDKYAYIADATVLNKYQKKSLTTGDVSTSGTVNLTTLYFNNLEIGKWYRIHNHAEGILLFSADRDLRFEAEHDGKTLARIQVATDNSPNAVPFALSSEETFQATATSVTVKYVGAGAGAPTLYGTAGQSFVELTELNGLQPTNEW